MLSAEQFATLTSAVGTIEKNRRDEAINVALSAGQLTPAEAYGADGKSGWRKALDDNESSTLTLLGTLPKGRVPVSELGTSATNLSGAESDQLEQAYAEFTSNVFGLPAPQKEGD